jgi:hypothetical protein
VVLHAINWPTLLGIPPDQLEQATVIVAMLVCLLAYPTLLVQVRHLSAFAVAGLCATCAVFLVTVVAPVLAELPSPDGSACPVLDASNHDDDVMGHAPLHVGGLGVATGLGLFAFAGHATFPELWKSMPQEERKRFGRSCDVGFGLAAGFYCGLAALGYHFFGDCVADSLTLNLMSSSPLLGSMATGCVLLSTFSSISVLCVPVVRIVTEATVCGDRKQVGVGRLGEQLGAGVGLWQPFDARACAIKGVLMLLAALLAVTVPTQWQPPLPTPPHPCSHRLSPLPPAGAQLWLPHLNDGSCDVHAHLLHPAGHVPHCRAPQAAQRPRNRDQHRHHHPRFRRHGRRRVQHAREGGLTS